MKLLIVGEGRVRMSLVIPSITGGGSSDIKIAQREIIQLDGICERVGMQTMGPNASFAEISPAHINYAFSTDLDDGRRLIEASIVIDDVDQWIQTNWLEFSYEPLVLWFTAFSDPFYEPSNYEGLSLSFSLPPEAIGGIFDVDTGRDSYISIITQPIGKTAPEFICYPYSPLGDTPVFTNSLYTYTLTFSLLTTT